MSGARRAAIAVLAILAAGIALLAWCLRPAGGLRGRYAIPGPEGGEVLVHERIDPRIHFPVPQAIDAAYIFHWDLGRFGFPFQKPVYLVHWRGFLRAPRAGLYAFAIDVQGEASLRLDGRPLEVRPDARTETVLPAGWIPIEIDYRLLSGEARLVLSWQPPGGRLQVVSAAHLAVDPATAARERTRRAAGFSLAVLAAAGVLLLGLGARRQGSMPQRLWSLLAPERTRIALGAIVLLAAILRFHDYALVPFHHETADEYQHAWEGWNLLHEGVPVAWSTFPDLYPLDQTRDLKWFGDRYVLVRPYFDHPPLFSLLVGLVNSLAGARSQWACTLPVMRLVPIVLSLAGILLLVPLARAYGASERAALLGALVYAALPLIVATHRLVKAESLLAILFMGTLLLVDRYERTGRRGDALLAGVLCGLSLWSKATGVAVPVVALVLLWSRRRHRAALIVLGTAGAFLGLYLLYAASYDFGIFLKVIRAQATTKWVSLDALLDLLGGKVVVKWFGRGWYLWLLLCAGVLAWRRERALLIPIAVYAVVIALTADQRVIYGWYRVPLYPFLCVAAGIYLEEMIREADLYRVFPFAATAAATGVLYALPEALARAQSTAVLFAALALAPYLIRLAHPRPATERLARGATYLLVAVFLVCCLAVVRDLLPIYAATRGVR